METLPLEKWKKENFYESVPEEKIKKRKRRIKKHPKLDPSMVC